MARPLRSLYPMSVLTRRRHRTWVVAMTLATAGAGVWGTALVWSRLAPASAPSFEATFSIASAFAVPGFLLALLSLRARLAWLLFALVPVFANGMLILGPWLALHFRRAAG